MTDLDASAVSADRRASRNPRPSRDGRAPAASSRPPRYDRCRCGPRVALRDSRHRGKNQRSSEAAVADCAIPTVPRAFRRKPDLELNVGIGGRFDHALHAAERSLDRHRSRRIAAEQTRRRRHGCRGCDRRWTENLAGEIAALGGLAGARSGHQSTDGHSGGQ